MDLKSFQSRTGLTQTDIAQQLSVTQATVSSWSQNRTTPSIQQLKALILMGMTISEVFDEETEAFVFKGKKLNRKKMSADVVETALAGLVNNELGKITDKDTCTQIVKIGLAELFAKKNE